MTLSEQEQAECNFLLEGAKNHNVVELMTALKALEEKCCDPAEAERRKALRETKAAARRKARYEAAKAKLEKERMERYQAWLNGRQKYKIYDQKGNRD